MARRFKLQKIKNKNLKSANAIKRSNLQLYFKIYFCKLIALFIPNTQSNFL
jgi:hypothetical protein